MQNDRNMQPMETVKKTGEEVDGDESGQVDAGEIESPVLECVCVCVVPPLAASL